ncbi:MAG: HAD family hydrolase [Ignavibacteria bacterium]
MLKVILFDIDGVIIRPPQYYSSFLEEHGYRDAAKILNEYYADGPNIKCLEGLADPLNSIKPFLDRIGWKQTPREYFKQQFEYESGYVDHEIIQKITLLRSKGAVCLTATDQDSLRSKYLLDNLGFRNLFDDNFISCDIGFRKKDSEFWDYVLGMIKLRYPNVSAHEILFCDDILENIEIAAKSGIRTFHVKYSKDVISLFNFIDSNI